MPTFDKDIEILVLKGEKGDSIGTTWGNIDGDIKEQKDLKAALNKKVNSAQLADVAISGSFTDLKNVPKTLTDLKMNLKNIFAEIKDYIYPVGSIYMSVKKTDPSKIFGGKWVRWGEGKVPVGVNPADQDFEYPEKTGGKKKHKLDITEIPQHYHEYQSPYFQDSTFESSSDYYKSVKGLYFWQKQFTNDGLFIKNTTYYSSQTDMAHNNLQPYITCYMWKRIY